MKHIKILVIQLVFLVIAFSAIYLLYPKTDIQINGNVVKFDSTNAGVIEISQNPDFSNSRFIELNSTREMVLAPDTYYWRASSIIQGMRKEFTIESEVGLKIDENESEIENIGNVLVNISKESDGTLVGHVILEPLESEKVETKINVSYVGRQEK